MPPTSANDVLGLLIEVMANKVPKVLAAVTKYYAVAANASKSNEDRAAGRSAAHCGHFIAAAAVNASNGIKNRILQLLANHPPDAFDVHRRGVQTIISVIGDYFLMPDETSAAFARWTEAWPIVHEPWPDMPSCIWTGSWIGAAVSDPVSILGALIGAAVGAGVRYLVDKYLNPAHVRERERDQKLFLDCVKQQTVMFEDDVYLMTSRLIKIMLPVGYPRV